VSRNAPRVRIPPSPPDWGKKDAKTPFFPLSLANPLHFFALTQYAKLLIAFVVAHTFTPIDLIPDFIPILGYLDDLVVTPLGIVLDSRMIPLSRPGRVPGRVSGSYGTGEAA
jgi:hypothetical protein